MVPKTARDPLSEALEKYGMYGPFPPFGPIDVSVVVPPDRS